MSDIILTSFIIICLVAANLPWLSERLLGFIPLPQGRSKRFFYCLLEWLSLYLIVGLLALGLENKTQGAVYSQDWEFYIATFCLFMVFALPGFIYRYEFRRNRLN